MTSFLRCQALLGTLLLGLPLASQAQTQRDLTEFSMDLYQQANSPDALARLNKALIEAPEAYLVSVWQPGLLILPDHHQVKVPGMRYNVAVRMLEVQDSTGHHVWPVGSLRGFDLGRGAAARHFRTLLVRNGSTRRDFVEVLTTRDDSPIILAVQNTYVHQAAEIDPVLRTVTRKERNEIGQTVVAGSASTPNEPLRPLALNQRAVGRLFGKYEPQIVAYAAEQSLTFTDLGQVLKMVEYYNRMILAQPSSKP
jgi:hypothetical protein